MIQKVEMTDRNFIECDLVLSGCSSDDAATLTAHLDDDSGPITSLHVLNDYRLEVAHSLSSAWLIRRLRALADGNDPVMAMAALEQLVKMAIHLGVRVTLNPS